MSDIERLRDRVEELEGLLGLRLLLPNELDLTPLELKIIGLLLQRKIASRDVIFSALYGGKPERDQPDIKTVEVHISKIRRKVSSKGLSIRNYYGVGYYLDDATREALKKIPALKVGFTSASYAA